MKLRTTILTAVTLSLFVMAICCGLAAQTPPGRTAQKTKPQTDAPRPSMLLADIAKNVESYKRKTVTMPLRLKHVDRVFEKIAFYDTKNVDIVFDYASIKRDPQFQSNFATIREGMMYTVSFVVRGTGALGEIAADLVKFEPAILDRLP
ncbi:MAG TPA: hypothetical protein PKM65_04260 [Spirochaetota bacterium]|nr:hypothetical protein [Spirochaetota bacterium]HNT10705.1 hypothetical protein [Spirochaetota bacterium]HOS41317.1 hypothetical protein [Spirochaetota bacterium]HPU90283.1 hypothetical protein [Spirochaetota bacterium]